MQNTYFIDRFFNLDKSESYFMSICLKADGFSVCIQDTEKKLLLLTHEQLREGEGFKTDIVKKAFDAYPIFHTEYKHIYIMISIPEKMLVPEEFFNLKTLADYYGISHSINEGDVLIYHKIEKSHTFIVSSIPGELIRFCNEYFNNPVIVHAVYPFIRYALEHISINTYHLFADIGNKHCDILLICGENIVLCNSYSYNSAKDVVYYILNIIDTEGIDRNLIYLNISGSVSSNKEIKNILSREIQRLSVLEIPELDHTIPKHTGFNSSEHIYLIHMTKCE